MGEKHLPAVTPQDRAIRDRTLADAKKSGLRLYNLPGEGTVTFTSGKDTEKISHTKTKDEVRELFLDQKIDSLIAARGEAIFTPRPIEDLGNAESRNDLLVQADEISEEIGSIRDAVEAGNRNGLSEMGVDPDSLRQLKEGLRTEAGVLLEKQIAASQRGILGKMARDRYASVLQEIQTSHPGVSFEGTPKTQLQQILESHRLSVDEEVSLRNQLGVAIEGFEENRFVDVFNRNLSDQWRSQVVQGSQVGEEAKVEGVEDKAGEIGGDGEPPKNGPPTAEGAAEGEDPESLIAQAQELINRYFYTLSHDELRSRENFESAREGVKNIAAAHRESLTLLDPVSADEQVEEIYIRVEMDLNNLNSMTQPYFSEQNSSTEEFLDYTKGQADQWKNGGDKFAEELRGAMSQADTAIRNQKLEEMLKRVISISGRIDRDGQKLSREITIVSGTVTESGGVLPDQLDELRTAIEASSILADASLGDTLDALESTTLSFFLSSETPISELPLTLDELSKNATTFSGNITEIFAKLKEAAPARFQEEDSAEVATLKDAVISLQVQIERHADEMVAAEAAAAQRGIDTLLANIQQGGEIPEELKAALAAFGWATPEDARRIERSRSAYEDASAALSRENVGLRDAQKEMAQEIAKLEQERDTAQETMRTARGENAQLLTRQREINAEISKLRDQLSETQRLQAEQRLQLVETEQKKKELQRQLTEAQARSGQREQVKATVPTTAVEASAEKAVVDVEATRARFKTYCDALLEGGIEVERGGTTEVVLSPHSRVETQTTFLDRDKSPYNGRFGMYRIENAIFGKTISVFGDPEIAGNALFGEATSEKAQQIGEAIELLSQTGAGRQLTEHIILGLVAAREYGYYGSNQKFFPGAIPRIFEEGKNADKVKFFMNVPKVVDAIAGINTTLHAIPGAQNNPILSEFSQAFAGLSNGELVRELKALVDANPDVYTADYTTDLETAKVGDKKASDVLIEVFRRNQDDCTELSQVTGKLATLLPLATMHSQMASLSAIDTPRIVPDGDSVVLTDARNPYAVLLSTAASGQSLGSGDSDWYRWFSLRDEPEWPPKVRITASLQEAIKNEIPISLEIHKDKPIILLTGNNGGGKTRAMETVAQTVARALVTGTNDTAKVLRMSEMREIRSLVGASRHTVELSSFQREATLVAEAIATLNNKAPNERGILIVDEVGKGTDSRDAIALMTAVSEYARRNNIYLLMATHHGQEFVGLADKLGLRDSMTILSPDLDTHQLKEYEQPVSSKGIEVMQARAKSHELPDAVTNILIENAMKIRQAVITDTAPVLSEVRLAMEATNGPLSFVDNETLRDIGMNFEGRGLADGYATDPLQRMARIGANVEPQAWKASYNRRQKEIAGLDEAGLVKEHALVKSLVDFARKSPDEFITFMKDSGGTFQTANLLFESGQNPQIVKQIEDTYARFLEGDLAKGMFVRDYDKREITAFLQAFGEPARRATTFDAAVSLGTSLSESGHEYLIGLGRRILDYSKMGETVERTMVSSEQEIRERFSAHMRNLAASAVRNRNTSSAYSRLGDTEAASLAGVLGETPTSSQDFFETVAKRIEAGDQAVYNGFSRWVIESHANKVGYSSIPQDSLYKDSQLEAVVVAAEEIEKRHRDIVVEKLPSGIDSGLNFREKIVDDYLSGDSTALFSLVKAASELRNKVYFRYETAGKVARAIEGLDMGKYFAWRKFVSKERPPLDEYYKVLGVSEDATDDEIRRAGGAITRKNHPDIVTPFEWQGKDINQAPAEIRDRVLAARELFAKAVDAQKALSDPAKNVPTALNMSYYATVANAIVKLNWAKAEYSGDGSFELTNSLAVGLLDQKDESEIIRQSISIKPHEDVVVIGGSNGNGKSQLLVQMASALEWAKTTGYVPAEKAVLPKLNFMSCMVNAGESTEGKSSFQNEIDRYIDLFNRYVKAGAPRDGMIFLDEPLSGTSSEDQIGIVLSMIDFFKQRNVRVVFTNHNYKTYEFMRRTTGSDGSHINFKPVAFLAGQGRERFKLDEFDPSNTDAIRSDGVKVAGEFGVPGELIQIAYFARDALTGTTTTTPEIPPKRAEAPPAGRRDEPQVRASVSPGASPAAPAGGTSASFATRASVSASTPVQTSQVSGVGVEERFEASISGTIGGSAVGPRVPVAGASLETQEIAAEVEAVVKELPEVTIKEEPVDLNSEAVRRRVSELVRELKAAEEPFASATDADRRRLRSELAKAVGIETEWPGLDASPSPPLKHIIISCIDELPEEELRILREDVLSQIPEVLEKFNAYASVTESRGYSTEYTVLSETLDAVTKTNTQVLNELSSQANSAGTAFREAIKTNASLTPQEIHTLMKDGIQKQLLSNEYSRVCEKRRDAFYDNLLVIAGVQVQPFDSTRKRWGLRKIPPVGAGETAETVDVSGIGQERLDEAIQVVRHIEAIQEDRRMQKFPSFDTDKFPSESRETLRNAYGQKLTTEQVRNVRKAAFGIALEAARQITDREFVSVIPGRVIDNPDSLEQLYKTINEVHELVNGFFDFDREAASEIAGQILKASGKTSSGDIESWARRQCTRALVLLREKADALREFNR